METGKRAGRGRGARKRRRIPRVVVSVFGISLWGTFALGAFAVSGGIHDLTTFGSSAPLNDGARIEQSFLSVVGTGYLDSFLRVQATQPNTTEEGYNTSHRLGGVPKIVFDDGAATDDVTDEQFTRGLRLSEVPTVVVDGQVYREFRLDLNEDQAKGYLLSMDGAAVWLGGHEFINYFDPVGGDYRYYGSASDPDFDGSASATLVWALEQDWWVKMNSSLSSGSGQLGDARLLVPAGLFGGADQVCAYDHSEPCDVFVYFDTLFGEEISAEATFEEWAVRVVPYITKTVETSLTRTYPWTIEKSVSPETWNLNTGDSGTSQYEVTVTKGEGVDSEWTVSGEITITNPGKEVKLLSVKDVIAGSDGTDMVADVICPVTFPFTLASEQSLVCAYTATAGAGDVTNPFGETNTATFEYSQGGVVETGIVVEDVDFSTAVITEVDEEITVVDDNATPDDSSDDLGFGPTDSSAEFSYRSTFTCDDDAGEYTNIATIVETGQEASATVTVHCYTPTVTKTAVERLTRTWTWTIDKSVSPEVWDLNTGDTGTSEFTINVAKTGFVDSDWSVSGEITIVNWNPSLELDVTGVTDVVDGAGAATVSCPGSSIAAGGSMTCSYGPLDLPDAASRLNTATAVYQNNDYDVERTATESGTSEVSGSAEVEFSDPVVTHVDEEITVVDDNATPDDSSDDLGFGPTDSSAEFSYRSTFTCDDDEGEHVNIATIVETGQEASATVTVHCYTPTVTKTAVERLTRTWTWTIDKSVSPEVWNLNTGDSGTSGYEVTVDKIGFEDSGWTVEGEITINNPNPTTALDVTAIVDEVDPGDFGATVSCPGSSVAAGGSITCSYGPVDLPDGADRINTVTATYQNYDYDEKGGAILNGTSDVSRSAAVDFSEATVTHVDEEINVSDSVQGFLGLASDDTTFSYRSTFTCDDDEGEHVNIATIVETGQEASATVTVHCYTPTVTKTAVERLTRTHLWTIDKSVSPEVWNLNTGDSGTSGYEVTVDKIGFEDSGWTVEGEITINNPNPTTALDVTAIVDEVDPGDFGATVSCPGSSIAAGGSITCSYGPVDLPDGADRINTVTATYQNYDYDEKGGAILNGTSDVSRSAAVDFSEATVTHVDEEINVSDSVQGFLGLASDDTTFSYRSTFTCDDDEGEHVNIATIVETGQEASATVTVHCYTPTVTKTAVERLTRTWTWTIDKVGDQAALTLMPGQAFWVNYQVSVDATSEDSDWTVEGEITINNPNPTTALDVTAIVDEVDPGDFGATVSCPGSSVAAGGSITCSYGPVDLPDGADRINTVTATYQNYDYDEKGGAILNGTSDVSRSAAVDFSEATVTHVDEEITVTDDNATPENSTDDVVLGTVSALSDTLPKVFSYGRFIGPYGELECGEVIVVNTASFVTDDTGSTGSDDHQVVVTIPCPQGCTLTQGYWKTHNGSFWGGAPADDAWYLIGDVDGDGVPEGEQELFFNSGQTWFEVYWTAPSGGNAYYQLAHQYMAARLNILNGASAPAEVTAAIGAAEAWFAGTTPDEAAALKGKQAKNVRDWASLLASYNEGRIGPGHCSEDATSNLTQ